MCVLASSNARFFCVTIQWAIFVLVQELVSFIPDVCNVVNECFFIKQYKTVYRVDIMLYTLKHIKNVKLHV